MIKRIELMNDWRFRLTDNDAFESIQLPHNHVELPFNYFDETCYQKVSTYERTLTIPKLLENQVTKLRFEGVMAYAKVYVDGEFLGEHKGGYTPFEFTLPQVLEDQETHQLRVFVDATEREDIPPFGGQIDYLTYGGIYREVSIDIYSPLRIENAKYEAYQTLLPEKGLRGQILVVSETEAEGHLRVNLVDQKGALVATNETVLRVEAGDQWVQVDFGLLKEIQLWSLDKPYLYEIKASLNEDIFVTRFGFREAVFQADGFYLNGERVKIRGLNRHQSWPYVGYAMPKRVQEKDADILKSQLHLNLVRTSHYPQSIHFLNRCDEIGLLVFEEIPGWQYIGDEAWQAVAVENVREMIERDWNHPSVILWGVRINESADNHDFYEKTNDMARRLDTTRAIGGVRCIDNSEFLEDVYTMNDFVNDGRGTYLREQQSVTGRADKVPYLVTEYNGHMYPTKIYDNEERQAEHVLRHAQVQHASYADPYITGAIGWCAFDYNTHKDFGAGDRICYHGVMDMFRNEKFAASVYKSQVSPDVEAVLKPVTFWARGERSIGGILPLIVLTNCDYITVSFGASEALRVDKRAPELGSLPYPPIIVDMEAIPPSKLGEWGMRWEDGIIRGYVNNQLVSTVHMSKNPLPTTLIAVADDNQLTSGVKDATRVIVKLLDQAGQVLPFSDAIISVTLDDESQNLGRIQGPSQFTLQGGQFGFYLETNGKPGQLRCAINILNMKLASVELAIEIA